MKTYYIKTQYKPGYKATVLSEVTEHEIQELLKNNPELLTPTTTHKRKYFVPKVGESYCFINNNGEILNTTNLLYLIDSLRFKIGNSFDPETTDAQDELNRRQALVRIWNNYDDKYHWDIDWEEEEKNKYGIDFNHSLKVLSTTCTCMYQSNTELPYFKSAEDRNQFVEANRDDLLIIFNIKK